MFESLDKAPRGSVKRWQAPRIGRVSPPEAVLPAFGDAPRVAAAGGAGSAPAAFSNVGARESAAEDGKDERGPDGKPATDAAGAGADAVATEVSQGGGSSQGPASSPPVERVDVGTSADDVALQRRFEEGRRQGWAEAQAARREAVVDESADLLASLARARDARDALLEEELLALARAMAKLIVRRELADDAGTMAGVVREALERLPRLADAPRVRLHPVDASAVSRVLSMRAEGGADGVSGGAGEQEGVDIVADETLARGDCRIESGATLIDAGIDAWLERIGVRHGPSETSGKAAADAGTDAGTGAASGTSGDSAENVNARAEAGSSDAADADADARAPDERPSVSASPGERARGA